MLIGHVVQLFGVLVVVVQFGLAVAPQGETPAGGTDALAVEFGTARHEGEGGVLEGGGGVG